MKTDDCRDWRHLARRLRARDSCRRTSGPGSRRTSRAAPSAAPRPSSLAPVARLLPLADPDRFSRPAPQPSAELGERDRHVDRRRAPGEPAAKAAAALRLRRGRRDGRRRGGGACDRGPARRRWRQPRAARRLRLAADRGQDRRDPRTARLRHRDPHVRERDPLRHPLPRLPARRRTGHVVPAGTFRYRWGDDSEAVLSSALDLSRTRAIGVRAGNRTFIAPVDVSGATTDKPTQEDAT